MDLRLAVYLCTVAFVLVTMLATYWRGRARFAEEALRVVGVRHGVDGRGCWVEWDEWRLRSILESGRVRRDGRIGGDGAV